MKELRLKVPEVKTALLLSFVAASEGCPGDL